MDYDEFPPAHGGRPYGMFTVVLTSVITSAVVTLVLLFTTGNLSLAPVGEPQGTGAGIAPPKAGQQRAHLVPSLLGLPTKSAGDLLKARGLRMVVRSESPSKKFAKGLIMEQEPLPDSELQSGGQVAVVVSSGVKKAIVPDVIGKQLAEARLLIDAAGIGVGEISSTGTGEPGAVTQVIPLPGTAMEEGAQVSLVVTPSGVEVPKLLWKRTSDAKEAIKNAGLKVGKIRWRYNENRPANLVLAQDPEAGTLVPEGSAVNLVLNEE